MGGRFGALRGALPAGSGLEEAACVSAEDRLALPRREPREPREIGGIRRRIEPGVVRAEADPLDSERPEAGDHLAVVEAPGDRGRGDRPAGVEADPGEARGQLAHLVEGAVAEVGEDDRQGRERLQDVGEGAGAGEAVPGAPAEGPGVGLGTMRDRQTA